MARADRNSYTSVIPEYYSDIFITFEKNPVTGLLKKVSNEDSIKQSIYLIVLTSMGERFYQPYFGSKIETSLFDMVDNQTADMIKLSIESSLKNHETRANILEVTVTPMDQLNTVHRYDDNAYTVTVKFECVNLPGQIFSVDVLLKRLR